jgi:hypothetical protein
MTVVVSISVDVRPNSGGGSKLTVCVVCTPPPCDSCPWVC